MKWVSVVLLLLFGFTVANASEINDEVSLDDSWELEEEASVVENRVSWGYYYNIDLYYASTGILFNLSDNAIPDIGRAGEGNVYLDLFKRSGLPQYVLFEFSLYPMPIAGVYARENHELFYQRSEVKSFNVLESVTAGFDEPYAISMFLNNMVAYGVNGDLENSDRGFMGYLFTVGNYHIQRNRLIDDNWMEIEWKIKGDIKREQEALSWSFRVGGKFHEHPEIVDNYYVVLKRDRVAANKPILSWLFNSGIEFTYSVDQTTLESIGFQMFLEKNFPIKFGSTVVSLGFGVLHENLNKYRGALRDFQAQEDQTFVIIRPAIQF